MEFFEAPAFTRYVSIYLNDEEYWKLQHFQGEQQIWLMTLCDKREASDLTPREKQALNSAIEVELRARQVAVRRKRRKTRG
jgi:hypothetical protein